ncbi:MAG TPA: glycosyltransferase family 9 protein [Candidatus Acidoferrum sp.]
MTEPRFLVVRLGSLGDIVHTFPAVAALRESFPKAEIVWLTHRRWQALVESSALATEIWEIETRSLASVRDVLSRIRKRKFTAAIDYQGLWKSAAIPFLGRVLHRIGFSAHSVREFGVPLLYTDRVRTSSAHVADQNGELSVRAGSRNGGASFRLSVPSLQEAFALQLLHGFGIDRYVVLSPAGGWRSKCWPPERYGTLCQQIHANLGLTCILNQGPGDDVIIAEVKAASGNAAPVACTSSVHQLMVFLRNALCVVAGDTGPAHLAVALGTPVVALFGPTDPVRNGPYRPACDSVKDIVLRSPHAVTSYRRRDEPDPSLLELDVATVFDAVRKQVEARR